jgi:hypothetical protein
MQTSKLYSEILKEIQKSRGLKYINEEKAAQSIEQLLLDKMEGFGEYLHSKDIKFFDVLDDERNYTTDNKEWCFTMKELIQLYLNK